MNIVFLTSRMNFLYSYMPLAHHLLKLKHNVSFIIPANEDLDDKQNSVKWHIDTACDIIMRLTHAVYQGYNQMKSKEADVIITIEGHAPQKYIELAKHHLIIQNFNDYTGRLTHKDWEHVYDNAIMWFQDAFSENLARELNFQGKSIVGTLPGYWLYASANRDELRKRLFNLDPHDKLAVCYLPRDTQVLQTQTYLGQKNWSTGDPKVDIEHAIRMMNFFEKEGYKIIFKQRSKNRNLEFSHLTNYIEDDSYFPYTSLDLAFVADVSVGYMSAAIQDVSTFGGSYINIEKRSYPKEIYKLLSQYYSDTIIGVDLNDSIDSIKPPLACLDRQSRLENSVRQSKSTIEKTLF